VQFKPGCKTSIYGLDVTCLKLRKIVGLQRVSRL